ncbi:hypothetical protein [Spirosoma areae]
MRMRRSFMFSLVALLTSILTIVSCQKNDTTASAAVSVLSCGSATFSARLTATQVATVQLAYAKTDAVS